MQFMGLTFRIFVLLNLRSLKMNRFKEIEKNTFTYLHWTILIYSEEFELFSNPEIDTRYYRGNIKELQAVIDSI